MSEQTKAALAEAIAAHVADESPGDMAGAWVMVAECLNLEAVDNGSATHWFEHEGSQYTVRGLLESAVDVSRFPPNHVEE